MDNLLKEQIRIREENTLLKSLLNKSKQELHQAQHELENFKVRFQRYFNLPLHGIAITSPQKEWIDFNDRTCAILGYSREELVRLKWSEITYPEDLPMETAQFERLLSGQMEQYTIDKRFVSRGGEIVWTSIAMGCVYKQDGSPDYIVAYMEDITSRKLAEHSLKESESRYRSLFENSLIGICLNELNGRIIRTNKAFARIFGYNNEKTLLSEVQNVNMLYKDPDKRKKIVWIFRKHGFVDTAEIEAIKRDGTPFFVLASISGVKTDTEIQSYLQATVIDITERKMMEKELKAASLYTRSLIEASLDPFITINADGKITDVNLATENITGLKREQLIGSDFAEFFTQPEKARIGYNTVFVKGMVRDYPLTILNQNGRKREVLYNATLFRNKDGEVQGVFAAARDITDRKKMESEMRKSRELLENLNLRLQQIREDERKVISREIHDELGQSLTALKLDLNMLSPYLQNNPEALVKLESMVGLLSNTIMDVQRIASVLRPQILDDLGLVPAIEWYCEEFENRSRIKCSMDLCEINSPDPRISLTFFRILQETLTNVIRHSKASEVDVILKKSEKGISLSIKDNGIGIPKNKIKSKHSLGLLSMNERVKQMGGKINILSGKGTGTKLTTFIPVKNQV